MLIAAHSGREALPRYAIKKASASSPSRPGGGDEIGDRVFVAEPNASRPGSAQRLGSRTCDMLGWPAVAAAFGNSLCF